MRVLKPSWARVVAVSSGYSVASATRDRGVGDLAKAAAHQGPPTILGHQPCYNGLLQVWPMVFGIAGGEANGVLVALGDRVATEGKARRVEMMAALGAAFLGTDRQRQLAQQQITPISMDFIERPTKLKAIAPLRSDSGTQQQIERLVSKKLGREGQRSLGKPSAMEEHPGYRVARCDLLLLIRNEARVDHTYQAAIPAHIL